MLCVYRYMYISNSQPHEFAGMYVVYSGLQPRVWPDKEWAKAHCIAAFITESEAKDYAEYRNEMLTKYGTDSVDAIEREINK